MKRIILFTIIISIFQFNILHSAIWKVIHSDENTITFYYAYNSKKGDDAWWDRLQNDVADNFCAKKKMDAYRGGEDWTALEGGIYMGGNFDTSIRYFCAKNDNEAKNIYHSIREKDLYKNVKSNDNKLFKKTIKLRKKTRKWQLKKGFVDFNKNIDPQTKYIVLNDWNEKIRERNHKQRNYIIVKFNAYSYSVFAKQEEIRKAKEHREKIQKEKEAKEKEKQRIKEAKEREKEKPEQKEIVRKPEKKIITSVDIDSSLITIGSGSGFYINNKGYALTNNHVIDICKQSIAVIDGKETLFRVIATDKTNDVAVLKTDLRSRNYIRINEDGAKLGENVIAVGYPLAGRLSDSVKITRGIVSSTSGLNNNIGQIQIDAALQPGNSGGPVLNENGELVGIASAGLNKLLMAKEAKYIPENVNFAVASPIVVNILKSKKIKYSTPSMFSGSYSNTELAELGNSSTIQLFCRNTRTAYNRLKSSNKYSTVLLDLD